MSEEDFFLDYMTFGVQSVFGGEAVKLWIPVDSTWKRKKSLQLSSIKRITGLEYTNTNKMWNIGYNDNYLFKYYLFMV